MKGVNGGCPKCGASEQLLILFLNGIACKNCGYQIRTDKMKSIKEFKEEQKKGAKDIRNRRLKMKDCQRGKLDWSKEYDQWEVYKASQEWRHRHIAYCMLRGRAYAEIEPKVRDGNEPNMRLVESIMENYTPPEVDHAESDRGQAEAVCAGEA